MSVQDNTEKVLRQMHRLIAKAEVYPEDRRYVLVEKREIQKLFQDLNNCMVELMEAYQLNKEGKENSERASRKQGEEIIEESRRRAEDVYAASVLYSNEALSEVRKMIRTSSRSMERIYADLEKKLQEQERVVRKNQSELRSHLRNMEDTDKYMRLIDEENYRLEAEARDRARMLREESSLNDSREPEIFVNQEILSKLGIEAQEVMAPVEEPEAMTVAEVIARAEENKAVKEAVVSEEASTEKTADDAVDWKAGEPEEVIEEDEAVEETEAEQKDAKNLEEADADAGDFAESIDEEAVEEAEAGGFADDELDLEELAIEAEQEEISLPKFEEEDFSDIELDNSEEDRELGNLWDDILGSSSHTLDNSDGEEDEDLITIELDDRSEKKEKKSKNDKKKKFSFRKK